MVPDDRLSALRARLEALRYEDPEGFGSLEIDSVGVARVAETGDRVIIRFRHRRYPGEALGLELSADVGTFSDPASSDSAKLKEWLTHSVVDFVELVDSDHRWSVRNGVRWLRLRGSSPG